MVRSKEDKIIKISDKVIALKSIYNVKIKKEAFIKEIENRHKFMIQKYSAVLFLNSKYIIKDINGDYWYCDRDKEELILFIENKNLETFEEYKEKETENKINFNRKLLENIINQ